MLWDVSSTTSEGGIKSFLHVEIRSLAARKCGEALIYFNKYYHIILLMNIMYLFIIIDILQE